MSLITRVLTARKLYLGSYRDMPTAFITPWKVDVRCSTRIKVPFSKSDATIPDAVKDRPFDVPTRTPKGSAYRSTTNKETSGNLVARILQSTSDREQEHVTWNRACISLAAAEGRPVA
jgi:hypothetical protein